MGVEKHLDSSSSASARLNKSHSVDIYRPPALRRNYESIDNENHYLPQQQQQNPREEQSQHQKQQQQQQPLQPNDKNCISANSLPTAATQIAVENGCNGIDTETTTSTTACSNQRQVRRERRPDRAVYVPRARRSQTTPPAVTTQQQQQQQPPHQEALPVTESNNQLTSSTSTSPSSLLLSGGGSGSSTTSTTTTNATARTCKSPTGEKSSGSSSTSRRSNKDRVSSGRTKEKSSSSSSSSKQISSTTDDTNDRDRNNSYKIKNSSNNNNYHNSEEQCNFLPPSSSSSLSLTVRDQRKRHQNRLDKSTPVIVSGCGSSFNSNSNELSNCNDKNALLVKDCDISNNPKEFSDSTNNKMMSNCKKSGVIVNNSAASDIKKVLKKMNNKTSAQVQLPVVVPENLANLRIEDALLGNGERSSNKCDRDAEELLRASKEINRSNRRIIKQTFNSDVLEIPDKAVLKPSVGHGRRFPKDDCKNVSAITSGSDDNEEDDWDSLYDDSGDCLDPKIIQELTASVGKVKIELPKMDYSAYLSKQSILNDEEFPHVLEVSNFPMEFKNQDLLMVFSQYKESGFEIKWVDDTHALAVFSSSQVAAEVLAMGHPFVVLKPLAEATVESRLKAKKCSASLQPYKPRPETCAALARRLVTGALGVRLKTAPQERENEKRVLREAKERKLLAAKQRDEAWES